MMENGKKVKKHGKGKMEYDDGDIYDGEWKEDEKHGYGESVEYWEEGTYGEDNKKKLVYKGEHKYGYKNGKGVGMYYNFDFEWIKYEGDWVDDVKEGRGIRRTKGLQVDNIQENLKITRNMEEEQNTIL